jgi:anti-anti-sigma factor
MRTNERRVGDVTILDVNGRLVWSDGDDLLRDTLRRLLSRGQTKIVLNLRGVWSVDCAGLGVLAEQFLAARKLGGNLKVLSPAGAVRHLLKICGLAGVIETYESEQSAVLSFFTATSPLEA